MLNLFLCRWQQLFWPGNKLKRENQNIISFCLKWENIFRNLSYFVIANNFALWEAVRQWFTTTAPGRPGVDFSIAKLNCVAVRPTSLHLFEAKKLDISKRRKSIRRAISEFRWAKTVREIDLWSASGYSSPTKWWRNKFF